MVIRSFLVGAYLVSVVSGFAAHGASGLDLPFLKCTFRGEFGSGIRASFASEGESFILRANDKAVPVGAPGPNGARLNARVVVRPSGELTLALRPGFRDVPEIHFKGSTCSSFLSADPGAPLVGGSIFNPGGSRVDVSCHALRLTGKEIPILFYGAPGDLKALRETIRYQQVRVTSLSSGGRFLALNASASALSRLAPVGLQTYVGTVPRPEYFDAWNDRQFYGPAEESVFMFYRASVTRSQALKRALAPTVINAPAAPIPGSESEE